MTNISDDPTIAYTEGRMQGKADVLGVYTTTWLTMTRANTT